MASVALKIFDQIQSGHPVTLFKSHREGYADGGQLRDFVSVRDCVAVIEWLLHTPDVSGIYNVGTGEARSFTHLAEAVFVALGRTPDIIYVDMPERLRAQYQYFTEANMGRLRQAGYTARFASLEDGVADYMRALLSTS